MRCRWLNVPRSVSWPVSRIGVPSTSSDAKASDSACAHSIPSLDVSASRRRSSCFWSLGCIVKPSGTASSSPFSFLSASATTAVLGSGALLGMIRCVSSARCVAPDFTACCTAARRCYAALARQLLRVFLPDCWRLLDPLIHHGLGVRRLIRLVVPVAAVTDEVDDDVGVEFLPKHHREPAGGEARFRIVGA